MAIDVFGAWFDDPDFFFRWIWHSQNTVWNSASYKNPEMDKLLDAARQDATVGPMPTLAKQFIKLAMTDVPVIPLYQPISRWCRRPISKVTPTCSTGRSTPPRSSGLGGAGGGS